MKLFICFFIFFSIFLFANTKECFKDKQSGKQICYERYFQKSKIHKAKTDEKYYTSKSGKIYEIGDQIEVKFKSVGAILTILDDYEVDFVDKTKGEKYIFRVRNKNEIFSILRTFNSLKSIQKALPITTRKYTKRYVEYVRQRKEEKLEKIKDQLQNPEKKSSTNKMKNPNFQGGNFLKGQAN